ncbi:hypothetical protein HMPREF1585_00615 [Gardnerella vaginalis JCP8481B]|nr:hypothetical protein HMPREF1585_00615 [Gardnerella vaginalis JCP8481B]
MYVFVVVPCSTPSYFFVFLLISLHANRFYAHLFFFMLFSCFCC